MQYSRFTIPSRPARPTQEVGFSGKSILVTKAYPFLDSMLHTTQHERWKGCTGSALTFKTLWEVIMYDIPFLYEGKLSVHLKYTAYRTSLLSIPIPNAIVAQT